MQKNITFLFNLKLSAFALALAFILFALTYSAPAQQNPAIDKKNYKTKPDDWQFIITPYGVLASQATDVGTTQLRQSFGDLSSLTNFGIQLATSVIYKKWVLTSDGTYANLGKQAAEGPLDINLNIKQYILDLRLGYLVVNRIEFRNNAVRRGWILEMNAGAKLWKNDVTLDYGVILRDPLPEIEGQIVTNQSWWDPMIGLKGRIFLNRKVMIAAYASYGGFGIGSASEYSWDFLYTNSFRVSQILLITTGFRAFKYKRTDPADDGEIETKVTVVGPLLGLSFYF